MSLKTESETCMFFEKCNSGPVFGSNQKYLREPSRFRCPRKISFLSGPRPGPRRKPGSSCAGRCLLEEREDLFPGRKTSPEDLLPLNGKRPPEEQEGPFPGKKSFPERAEDLFPRKDRQAEKRTGRASGGSGLFIPGSSGNGSGIFRKDAQKRPRFPAGSAPQGGGKMKKCTKVF